MIIISGICSSCSIRNVSVSSRILRHSLLLLLHLGIDCCIIILFVVVVVFVVIVAFVIIIIHHRVYHLLGMMMMAGLSLLDWIVRDRE